MSVPAPGLTAAVGTEPGEPELSEADLIAAAVLGCPNVAGLHGGRYGEVATYLPGRRIVGVRIRPVDSVDGASPSSTAVEVHVTARYPAGVADIDATVRAAVHTALSLHPDRVTPGRVTVSIVVGDVVADHPAIGGPVGDRPVFDSPEPVTASVPTQPSERPDDPAELPLSATGSASLTASAASGVIRRPATDTSPVQREAVVVPGDVVTERVLTERVVLERVVTADAVTGRVTVEHFVVADPKVDPVVGPGVALDGGVGRETRPVGGDSASEQEKR